MRRREFITLLGGAAAWPIAAPAQPCQRPVIGWLGGSSRQIATRNLNAFLQGLREYGHEDGKDIVYRWAEDDQSRQPALAKELVALSPAVIVAAVTPAIVALRQFTTTIPIVGALLAEP